MRCAHGSTICAAIAPRVWVDVRDAGIAGPAVGLGGRPWGDVGRDEGVQGCGGEVGDRGEAHPAWHVVDDLDGAGDEHLAVAVAATAGNGVFPGPVRDHRLVDFDDPCQEITVRRDHRPADLGAEQLVRLIRPESELSQQLQRRDAVGMGGHEVGRPEPDGERELGACITVPRGYRGLPAAAGALPGERVGGEFPSLGRVRTPGSENRPASEPQPDRRYSLHRQTASVTTFRAGASR